MLNYLGNRKIVIVRELTKLYEEIIHTSLHEGYQKEPRGEFVIVVEGQTQTEQNELDSLTLDEHLNYYLNLKYTKNEAIKQIAKDKKTTRQEVYNALIKK